MATSDKYDRQLRLWGSHGQKSLMEANILLIQADGAGAETLKNLVLPGVGKFTIWDSDTVSEDDLDSNFFVDLTCIGKSRAQAVCENLCEMNPDVIGSYCTDSLIESVSSALLLQFTLVIASNIPQTLLIPLAEYLWKNKIPFIYQQSFGLLGLLRIQIENHNIIESKPDNERFDLRLSQPFPQLVDYCNTFDFDSLDSQQHSHIPSIVILVKAMQSWKLKHNNALPMSLADREDFKLSIKQLRRDADELNFIEAYKQAYMAYSPLELPDEVIEIMDFASRNELTDRSCDFSFLVHAMKNFLIKNHGLPPLAGKLPDMTATTDFYLQLQQIYHEKAKLDSDSFTTELQSLLMKTGRNLNSISEECVNLFCCNIFNIRSITTRSIADEWVDCASVDMLEILDDDLYADAEQTPIYWYTALRAAHKFYSEEGRWPCNKEDVDLVYNSITELNQIFGALISDTAAVRRQAEEIVRFAGKEIHSISAIIGGMASQEAVKLITKQYLCMNNSYIFNGIAGCGAKYGL